MVNDNESRSVMTSETLQTSRRSVAKGLAWTVPAVALAGAAPAMAASCDPASNIVHVQALLSFASSGDLTATPSAVSATYTNTGSETVVAGTVLTFSLRGSYQPGGTDPTAAPTSLPSSATFSVTGSVVGAEPEPQYLVQIEVTLGQALAAGQSISISTNATGFSSYASTTSPDTGYNGNGVYSFSQVNDATKADQTLVATCQTVDETITVSSN